MTQIVTEEDIRRGYKMDYKLSWRKIIDTFGFISDEVSTMLDALHDLIPNESDVSINIHGEPNLDSWNVGRRRDEIYSWLMYCAGQELITHYELEYAWREIRQIL